MNDSSSVHIGDLVTLDGEPGTVYIISDIYMMDEPVARLYEAGILLGMAWPLKCAGDWLLADVVRLQ